MNQTKYNNTLSNQAKKRRAEYFKQFLGGKSIKELAEEHSMSRQRMHLLLQKAEVDNEGSQGSR